MHRASLQHLFTNIKNTHLTIVIGFDFFQNHLQLQNRAIEKRIVAIKDTFTNNPI